MESYCTKAVLFFSLGNLSLASIPYEIFFSSSVRYLQESHPVQSLQRAIRVRKLPLTGSSSLEVLYLAYPILSASRETKKPLSRKASVSLSVKHSSYINFIMTLLYRLCYSMKLGMGVQERASVLAKAALFWPPELCCSETWEGVGYPR